MSVSRPKYCASAATLATTSTIKTAMIRNILFISLSLRLPSDTVTRVGDYKGGVVLYRCVYIARSLPRGSAPGAHTRDGNLEVDARSSVGTPRVFPAQLNGRRMAEREGFEPSVEL